MKISHSVFCIIILFAITIKAIELSEFDQNIEFILKSKSPKYENEIEQEIVKRQISGFCYYVKDEFGHKKWEYFLFDFEKTKSISKSMLNIYHKSIYQLAGIINYKLDKSLPKNESTSLVDKTIYEYHLIYNDKSRAEKDLIYLEYLLNKYYKNLQDAFFVNNEVENKYRTNIENLRGKKVDLFLMTNKDLISEQFGNVKGTAATLVGFTPDEKGVFQMHTRLLFKYHELFTSAAFLHEITHVFWALSYMNPDYTKAISTGVTPEIEKNIREVFKPFSEDTPLKEGLAEYFNAKFNLLYKYGYLEDVDVQLKQYYSQKKESFDLNELSSRIYDFKDDAPTYEIAHSLFKFISIKYGFEKALEMSYSLQRDEDYKRILGTTLSDISKEWNKKISTP